MRKHSHKQGFSLIEIMVVVFIFALLAGLVIANFTGAKEKAKVSRASSEISLIRSAILMLQKDTGKWPGSQVDLVNGTGCSSTTSANPGSGGTSNAMKANDVSGDEICLSGYTATPDETGITRSFLNPISGWNGPYMASIPLDPWGDGYVLDTDFVEKPGVDCYKSGGGQDYNSVAIVSAGPDKKTG